ncbi:MAG: 50S ribosomal protein L11 methyltransferase [Bacteroidales bacterium]|nr:50S ribosomal protein L11 methyltransferase [Bacteroidales bacterium]MCD8394218.1 50S ribosomal protein L11 methyltransferase [Bacteroidales bacterium]
MNDYIATRIELKPCDETATDLLAYELGEAGYESFVPDEHGLTAYIRKELADEQAVVRAVETLPGEPRQTTITHELIEGQDWNSEWERHYFQPIVVGDQCVVHSSFHTDYPKAQYDIVIDPKMAFGTGHHATTEQMLTGLLSLDLEGKSVIDMGTGTGILAILAAMRGASTVTGIEIDPMAQENAVENVAINHHPEIKVLLGDVSSLKKVEPADVFLANINRNVILNDLSVYVEKLKPCGTMLLSGFYLGKDADMVEDEAKRLGLTKLAQSTINQWTCLMLSKIPDIE